MTLSNDTDRSADASRTAVLLIAHGSRRPEANDDLRRLAELLRARRPHGFVEIAYLELATPTIDEAGRSCVSQGARRVLMLPFFLSAGKHVVDDLERHRRELATEFPATRFELCGPLGLHPLVVEALLDRLREVESP